MVKADPDKKRKRWSKKQRRRAWKRRQAWKKRRRRARLKRRWRQRRDRQKAQPVDTAEVRLAKGHNAAARELFMLSKYAEAAEEYKKAYKSSAHPEFLYNIGQCYSQLDSIKDLQWAVHYFKEFLRQPSEVVNAKDVRAEILAVEDQLRLLREEQAQQRQQAENERLLSITAPGLPTGEQPSAPVYKKWWFWGMIGVLAGGTAAAIVALQAPNQEPVVGTMEPGQIRMP